MSGARANEHAREEEKRTSMSMNRTHSNSIAAAASRRASGRACAGLFSEALRFAAVLCPGSLPTYLPGGELMRKDADSTIQLWNAGRRQVSLM
jgi:hypothetical protein